MITYLDFIKDVIESHHQDDGALSKKLSLLLINAVIESIDDIDITSPVNEVMALDEDKYLSKGEETPFFKKYAGKYRIQDQAKHSFTLGRLTSALSFVEENKPEKAVALLTEILKHYDNAEAEEKVT